MCAYCIFSVSYFVYSMCSFSTWILLVASSDLYKPSPVQPILLYCVGGDVKPCSINQSNLVTIGSGVYGSAEGQIWHSALTLTILLKQSLSRYRVSVW